MPARRGRRDRGAPSKRVDRDQGPGPHRRRGDDAGLARWLATRSDALAGLVRQATGRRLRVELLTARPAAAKGGTTTEIKEVEQWPLVKAAMEIFDASVVEVEDSPSSSEPGEGS